MRSELPSVENIIVNEEKKVVYRIMAYRKLTREEMVLTVRNFRATKGNKRIKPNTEIRIITVFR